LNRRILTLNIRIYLIPIIGLNAAILPSTYNSHYGILIKIKISRQ